MAVNCEIKTDSTQQPRPTLSLSEVKNLDAFISRVIHSTMKCVQVASLPVQEYITHDFLFLNQITYLKVIQEGSTEPLYLNT